MLITPNYAETWGEHYTDPMNWHVYGTGKDWAPKIVAFMRHNRFTTALDFGCGHSEAAKLVMEAYPKAIVQKYDPAIKGHDKWLDWKVDLIYALDVLQCVEPEHLDPLLSKLRDLKPKGLLFWIMTVPAQNVLPDGQPDSCTVQPGPWWLEKLGKYFRPLSTEDPGYSLFHICAPLS